MTKDTQDKFEYNENYLKSVDSGWNQISFPTISNLIKNSLKLYSFNKVNILDLGCGSGIYSDIFKQYGQVYGFDYSKSALKLSKNKYHSSVNANAENLPFKNNSFTIIFSSEVIEHVLNWTAMIQEVGRILKPNGIFILTTTHYSTSIFIFLMQKRYKNKLFLITNIFKYIVGYFSLKHRNEFIREWAFEPLGGHYHGFLINQLSSELKKSDFNIKHKKGFYAYPPIFIAQGGNLKRFWIYSNRSYLNKLFLSPIVVLIAILGVFLKTLGLFANNIYIVAEKADNNGHV